MKLTTLGVVFFCTVHFLIAQNGSKTNLTFTAQGHAGLIAPKAMKFPGRTRIVGATQDWGVNNYLTIHRWLVGIQVSGAFSSLDAKAPIEGGSALLMGFLNGGYRLRSNDRWANYLQFGIGGGALIVGYENQSAEIQTLPDGIIIPPKIKANPGSEVIPERNKVNLSSEGIGWQAGIAFQRRISNWTIRGGRMYIGMYAGIYHFPSMNTWYNSTAEQPLTGVHRPKLFGSVIRLTVGGMF